MPKMFVSSSCRCLYSLFSLLLVSFYIGADGDNTHNAYDARGSFIDELVTRDGRSLECKPFKYFDELVSSLDEYKYWFHKWSSSYIDNMLNFTNHTPHFVRFKLREGHLSALSSGHEDRYHMGGCPNANPPSNMYFDRLRDGLISYIHRLSTQYELINYLGKDTVDFIFLYAEIWSSFNDKSLPEWLVHKQNFPVFRFHTDACQHLSGLSQRWMLMNRDQVRPEFKNMLNMLQSKTVSNDTIPWRQRKNLAIFRGAPHYHLQKCLQDASEPADDNFRLQLVKQAAQEKVLKDVKLCIDGPGVFKNDTYWDSAKEVYANQPDQFTFQCMQDLDEMKYKFIIVADRIVSPDRLMIQLMYGSVVFKQRSFYQPMLSYDLIENEHFISFDNATDLVNQLNFYIGKIKKNDSQVIDKLERIAYNGFKFAIESFNLDHMDCNVINILKLYSNVFPNIRNNNNNISIAKETKANPSDCQEIIPEESDAFQKYAENSKLIYSNDIDVEQVAQYWFPSITIERNKPKVAKTTSTRDFAAAVYWNVPDVINYNEKNDSDDQPFSLELSALLFGVAVSVGTFALVNACWMCCLQFNAKCL